MAQWGLAIAKGVRERESMSSPASRQEDVHELDPCVLRGGGLLRDAAVSSNSSSNREPTWLANAIAAAIAPERA